MKDQLKPVTSAKKPIVFLNSKVKSGGLPLEEM